MTVPSSGSTEMKSEEFTLPEATCPTMPMAKTTKPNGRSSSSPEPTPTSLEEQMSSRCTASTRASIAATSPSTFLWNLPMKLPLAEARLLPVLSIPLRQSSLLPPSAKSITLPSRQLRPTLSPSPRKSLTPTAWAPSLSTTKPSIPVPISVAVMPLMIPPGQP